MKAVLKWSVMRERNSKGPILTQDPQQPKVESVEMGESPNSAPSRPNKDLESLKSRRIVKMGQNSPQDFSQGSNERLGNNKPCFKQVSNCSTGLSNGTQS